MIRLQILGIAIAALAVAPASADPSYVKFTVDGAVSTDASGIDGGGNVGGYYATATGKCRAGCGFVRAPDGTISTFVVKGCTSGMEIRGMNALGDMIGFCRDKATAFSFIRASDGTITRVKRMKDSTATLNAISSTGITGGDFLSPYGFQPFLRMPDGSKRVLEGVKHRVGSVEGISPSGILTGEIATVPSSPAQAFIDVPGEKIQTVSIPDFSWAMGRAINDAGDVAGMCGNTNQPPQGFVRNADGSTQTFDLGVTVQGNVWVSALATVDTDRQVAGHASNDSNEHGFGFIRHDSGAIETFDISGNKAPSAGTYVTGVSDTGVAVGSYIDQHYRHHAFIRMP